MADTEAVYRYGSTDGEVVARHEVGPDTYLPSMGENITLPGSDSERRFIVTSRFPPSTVGFEREAAKSTYTIVVKDADR